MNRVNTAPKRTLLSTLLMALFCFIAVSSISGCSTPPPNITIYDDINVSTDTEKNIDGAEVYWGTTRETINEYIGVTPYQAIKTSVNPMWSKGYFKIVKSGYKPAIVNVSEVTMANRLTSLVLQPLPKYPTKPQFFVPDTKDIAVTELNLEYTRQPSFYLKKENAIAVVPFQEPVGSGAGALFADNMLLDLLVKGFNVIDREQVDRVMRDKGLSVKGKTMPSEVEISEKLGKLVDADYVIYGAITEYVSKNENILFAPQVETEDRHRYDEERKLFIAFYDEFAGDLKPLPSMPKTLAEWEMDSAKNAKSEYINIARVGVTAKIVNTKTATVVWSGFASLQDLRIQSGIRRIVKGLNESFITKP